MAAIKRVPTELDKLIEQGLIRPSTDPAFTVHRVSSGLPQLDAALGGGYAFARNVLIVGPESTGKTILAQYAAASVQREPKATVLLIDAEMSFDREWWSKTEGLDADRLYVSQPPSGEAAIDVIVAMAKSDANLRLIILDSIAALSPTSVQEKSAGERTVASIATLVNNLYQRLTPVNHRAVFLAINQLRDNMNGYDDVYPGGRAQRHYSHIILRTRREGWIKEKDVRIGYMMEVYVKKNKLGSPEAVIQLPFLYGLQVDMVQSYIDEAIEQGIIATAGPYYEFEDKRVLGKAALRAWFTEEEAAFVALKRRVELREAGA